MRMWLYSMTPMEVLFTEGKTMSTTGASDSENRRRPRSKRYLSYGLVLVCAVLLGWAFKAYLSVPLVEEEVQDLSVIQQKQLEMYVEMIKLLITFGTFLLGLIGAMFTHFYGDKPTPRRQVHLALVAAVLAGSSIIFGYLSYQRLILMLQVGFFNLSQHRINWTNQFQFILLLLSVVGAAWFGYRATEEDRR